MDSSKAIEFLNRSFLSELLNKEDLTDISFNGTSFFYVTNTQGRLYSDIKVEFSEIKDFLRQIANMTEKQFSYQSPFLDVSIGPYRINAVHQSIARKNNEDTLTFSIRKAGQKGLINDSSGYLCPELVSLFEILLDENISLVIGGITGTGKTELQKYFVSKMKDNTRIIVIDNVLELSNVFTPNNLDLNIWQVDEKNKEANIQALVRNALRSNPDWLIVAESRGAEMIEVLNSAMTGHPIITTLHALDAKSMPSRIGRMVLMNDKKMDFESVMQDIYYHFRFYIYLKKEFKSNGNVERYISDIIQLNENGKSHHIYQYHRKKRIFNALSKEFLSLLKEENLNKLPEVFK